MCSIIIITTTIIIYIRIIISIIIVISWACDDISIVDLLPCIFKDFANLF